MQHNPFSFATAMVALAHRLLVHPWRMNLWRPLVLLLLGVPLVWAADVSIVQVTVTTVRQLAFAEADVGVAVGSRITRTATTQLSRGAVTYSSAYTAIATVDAGTGEVTGVGVGVTTITAIQKPSPPYASASAHYTIRVGHAAVAFDDWTLTPVTFGAQPFQIKAPTSNVTQAGGTPTITYSTLNNDTSVVSITESGMVTVRGTGDATIVADQAATGTFSMGQTTATLSVLAAPATFTMPEQQVQLGRTLTLTDPTDSPNQLGAFSHVVQPDAQGRTIATVAGHVLTPVAAGETTLTVTQAAHGNHAESRLSGVKLTVAPADFTITGFTFTDRPFDAVNPGNNTFALPSLAKPDGSRSTYRFEITGGDTTIATITNGMVTVSAPGSVEITATLPMDPALHEEATAIATLRVLAATPQTTLALEPFGKFTTDGPFLPPWTGVVGDASSIEVSVVNRTTNVVSVGADKQTLTLTGLAGEAEVTLTQPARNGLQGAKVMAVLTVKPGPFTIQGLGDIVRDYDPFVPANNQFDLPELARPEGSTAPYTFTSSDTSVATIVGRTVTVLKPSVGLNPTYVGITASLPEDPLRHQAATATVKLTVNKATPKIVVDEVRWIFSYDGTDPPWFITSKIPVRFTLPQGTELDSVRLVDSTPEGWGTLYQDWGAEGNPWWVHMDREGSGVIEVTTRENEYFYAGVGRGNISGQWSIRKRVPPSP